MDRFDDVSQRFVRAAQSRHLGLGANEIQSIRTQSVVDRDKSDPEAVGSLLKKCELDSVLGDNTNESPTGSVLLSWVLGDGTKVLSNKTASNVFGTAKDFLIRKPLESGTVGSLGANTVTLRVFRQTVLE
jgi:hypothetical protein